MCLFFKDSFEFDACLTKCHARYHLSNTTILLDATLTDSERIDKNKTFVEFISCPLLILIFHVLLEKKKNKAKILIIILISVGVKGSLNFKPPKRAVYKQSIGFPSNNLNELSYLNVTHKGGCLPQQQAYDNLAQPQNLRLESRFIVKMNFSNSKHVNNIP